VFFLPSSSLPVFQSSSLPSLSNNECLTIITDIVKHLIRSILPAARIAAVSSIRLRNVVALVGTLAALAQPGLARERWTAEEAWQWYYAQPWLVGANWMPVYAATTVEVWQADPNTPGANTFDINQIAWEFDRAKTAGMNTLRIFLCYEVWKADRDGFMSRLEQVVAAAAQRGIKPLLVHWDDVSFSGVAPHLGVQPDPIPGVHNSQWNGTGQAAVLNNPGSWQLDRTDPAPGTGAKQYVQDIVGTYANDPRIVGWDLYNEPGSSGAGALLTASVQWAREMNPIQPIAPNAFSQWYDLVKGLADIINIHAYPGSAGQYQIDGRPVIVSEWMYRSAGDPNPIARLLPLYHAKRIGIWQWGLVNGDTQTHFPWGWSGGTTEPDPWFHDLFRRDGTPYRQSEIDLYALWSSTPPPDPPAPPAPPPPSGLIENGSFEFNAGDGSTPTGWTKDFNCHGAWSGGTLSGSSGLHPGNAAGSGGIYQDFTTTTGATYQITLSLQNFNSQAGASRLRVLAGPPASPAAMIAIDDSGHHATAFDSDGLIANQLAATAADGSWSQITFQFTATGATTRCGLYNAAMLGDTVHSINSDDFSITPQGGGNEVIANGGFETNGGNGSMPTGWTLDFNSYGAYSGAAHTGTWGLHPGVGAASGGRYQDFATISGTTYNVSFWAQNFGSAAGTSHVRALVGTPIAPALPVAIDDRGAATSAFRSDALLCNVLHPSQADGSWTTVRFEFTATGTTTRLGLYNAYMSALPAGTNGDGNHSLNVDNVSVTETYASWASTQGLTGTAGDGSSLDPAFAADPNQDGIQNGMAWILGAGALGDPAANLLKLPAASRDGTGALVLTFDRLTSSAVSASLVVQYGDDLGGTGWTPLTVGTSGGSDGNITIAVTQGAGSTADYDRITVTIPATYLAGHPKTFARLMANLIP
jgi:hypothetical protein